MIRKLVTHAIQINDVLGNLTDMQATADYVSLLAGARTPGVFSNGQRGAATRANDGPPSGVHGSLPLRFRRPLEHPPQQAAQVDPVRRAPRHLRVAHEQGEHSATCVPTPFAGFGHPKRSRHAQVPAISSAS